MHAAKSRRFGLVALALALVTLFVIGVLSYQDGKQYRLAFAQAHEVRRILDLDEIVIDSMRDAETSQRGFLLTGRGEYLEPYSAAVARIPAEMSELTASATSTPAQSARLLQLQQLVADKLAELQRTIELRQSAQPDAALAVVETGQGKQMMDRIRLISQEIDGAENARWISGMNDLQNGAQRVRIVTLFAALFLVALVGSGGGALNGAALKMERLNAELGELKRSAEHTRDLLRATLYSIGDAVITTDREGGSR